MSHCSLSFSRGTDKGGALHTGWAVIIPVLTPTPCIRQPRALLYFQCFATLQTIYRNSSTFFSLTSDFFIHPFPHLIRDESHSPRPDHQKVLIETMWLQCESSGLVNFLGVICPAWCNSCMSPALCTCGAECSFTLHDCGHHPSHGSYSLPFQKENIFPFSPCMRKAFLFSVFQRKFLPPQTLRRNIQRWLWKCVLLESSLTPDKCRLAILLKYSFHTLGLVLLFTSLRQSSFIRWNQRTNCWFNLAWNYLTKKANVEELSFFPYVLILDLLKKQSLSERAPSETWTCISSFSLQWKSASLQF